MATDDTKLVITAGDLLRYPQVTLLDPSGNRVNLYGLTVVFRMVNVNTGAVAVNNNPVVVMQNNSDPTTWGNVSYQWNSGETSSPGLYRAWFIVSNGSAQTTHFPPSNNFYILILNDF